MVVQDRRVQRTQTLLAQALIDLTLERGYEEVTIRDITERAEVGYATFFRHYHDKDALLAEVLDVVLAEIADLLSPESLAADSQAVGVIVFRYVQAHTELVRVLLGSRLVLQRLIAVVTARIAADHAPRPDSVVPLAVAAHHYVSATIALIGWWLDAGQPYPPEQMGRIYHELIAMPTGSLAFAG